MYEGLQLNLTKLSRYDITTLLDFEAKVISSLFPLDRLIYLVKGDIITIAYEVPRSHSGTIHILLKQSKIRPLHLTRVSFMDPIEVENLLRLLDYW